MINRHKEFNIKHKECDLNGARGGPKKIVNLLFQVHWVLFAKSLVKNSFVIEKI